MASEPLPFDPIAEAAAERSDADRLAQLAAAERDSRRAAKR